MFSLLKFTPLRKVFSLNRCAVRIQRCEERVILRNVLIQHGGLQERDLQIAHLLPLDDVGMQVEVERAHDRFDVAHGRLGVPAAVDMHRQQARRPSLRLATCAR